MGDNFIDKLEQVCDYEPVMVFDKAEFDNKPKKKRRKNDENKPKMEVLKDGEVIDLFESPLTSFNNKVIDDEYEITDHLNLIDMDKIYYGDDSDDDFSGNIVRKGKGNYNKLKESDNEFKKEFSDELALLYDALNDLNKFDRDLTKKYDSMENSKTRGVSKYTNDLIVSMLSCKSNKLAVIKEITAIKKTIADLSYKTKKADNGGEGSAEAIASAYLNNILGMGRSNFVNTVTRPTGPAISAGDDYHFEDDDEVLSALDGVTRSDELDAYVKYEALEPKICIKRYIDTGDWKFIVIDKNGNTIPDYPIPDKDTVGTMKFTDDGTSAADKHGRSYKVIEIYSGNDEDDEFDN